MRVWEVTVAEEQSGLCTPSAPGFVPRAVFTAYLRPNFSPATVAQARAARARLPAAERGTSTLLSNMGTLLREMGKLGEAKPLFEEYMQGCRETLGDRHTRTR